MWKRALSAAFRTTPRRTISSTVSSRTSRAVSVHEPTTEFERTVSRLLQLKQGRDSGAISMLWRNPVVCYSRHGLGKPLTSLASDALQTEATKLAKV